MSIDSREPATEESQSKTRENKQEMHSESHDGRSWWESGVGHLAHVPRLALLQLHLLPVLPRRRRGQPRTVPDLEADLRVVDAAVLVPRARQVLQVPQAHARDQDRPGHRLHVHVPQQRLAAPVLDREERGIVDLLLEELAEVVRVELRVKDVEADENLAPGVLRLHPVLDQVVRQGVVLIRQARFVVVEGPYEPFVGDLVLHLGSDVRARAGVCVRVRTRACVRACVCV